LKDWKYTEIERMKIHWNWKIENTLKLKDWKYTENQLVFNNIGGAVGKFNIKGQHTFCVNHMYRASHSTNMNSDISNSFPNRSVNREENKGHALKYIGPNNEYYVCRHCFSTIRHTWDRFVKHKAVCADKHTK